jgi:aspartate-semialdehyde dehydrogenase
MTLALQHEPVSANLADMRLLRSFAYVDGHWVAGADNAAFEVSDPATGAVIGDVARLTAGDSAAAVDAATRAFPGWAALLPQDRARILRRWFELIIENKEDLAQLMTLEQGKPLSEARGEIDYGASFVEFYAEEAKRPNIEGITSHLPDAEVELWMEPAGVAALITPWNFPHAMITRKAAAALAAGCPVLVHPSCVHTLLRTRLGRACGAGRLSGRGLQRDHRETGDDCICLDGRHPRSGRFFHRVNGNRPAALSAKRRHG